VIVWSFGPGEAGSPGDAPARVVLRAPNWLGDAVMGLPAMAAVRDAFPRSRIALAAPASIAPLFREITPAAPDEIVTVEKPSEAAALRAGGFDLAILFPNSFRTAWVCRRAGIRQRWGYGAHGRRFLLTRAIARPRGRRHHSEYYGHLVRELGCPTRGELPAVRITAATARRVDDLFDRLGIARARPLVGIAPGAAYGHAKRWPAANVAELARRLIQVGAVPILVGAAGDREAGREIESVFPADAGLVNLIGRTDLRLLAGLLAACHAFVSNDSGAMHLAAAVGVPVAAMFGPTDERATAPLGDNDVIINQVFCRPCMLRECPIDHRCMRGIAVDTVFAAVMRRLSARSALEVRPA
jgi:heptosyltransferase-2